MERQKHAVRPVRPAVCRGCHRPAAGAVGLFVPAAGHRHPAVGGRGGPAARGGDGGHPSGWVLRHLRRPGQPRGAGAEAGHYEGFPRRGLCHFGGRVLFPAVFRPGLRGGAGAGDRPVPRAGHDAAAGAGGPGHVPPALCQRQRPGPCLCRCGRQAGGRPVFGGPGPALGRFAVPAGRPGGCPVPGGGSPGLFGVPAHGWPWPATRSGSGSWPL